MSARKKTVKIRHAKSRIKMNYEAMKKFSLIGALALLSEAVDTEEEEETACA